MRKTVLLFILSTALLSAQQGGWTNLAQTKVAVLETETRVTGESLDTKTLTEIFQSALVDQRAFIVVERTSLDRVLAEQELQISGLTEAQISRVGQLAGANKVLSPSISKLGSNFIFVIRSIDTTSGVVDLSDQASAATIDELVRVLPEMARRMVRKARGERVGDFNQQQTGVNPPASNPSERPLHAPEGIQISATGTANDNQGQPENVADRDPLTWWLAEARSQPRVTLEFERPFMANNVEIVLNPVQEARREAPIRLLSFAKRIRLRVNDGAQREFDIPRDMVVFNWDIPVAIELRKVELTILEIWPGRRPVTGVGEILVGMKEPRGGRR